MNPVIQKAVNLIPKILGPSSIAAAFVYIINNRRTVEISFDFIKYEFQEGRLSLAIILVIGLFSLFILLSFRLKSSLRVNIFELKRFGLNIPMSTLVLIVTAILVYSTLNIGIRYSYFSQVYYQQQIYELMEEGGYGKARRLSQKYLRLYPQRLPDKLNDPLINPLLEFNTGMSKMKNSMQSINQLQVTTIEGLEVPVLNETRSYAYELMDDMSGGITIDE